MRYQDKHHLDEALAAGEKVIILFNMYGKKIVGVVPILLGLIVGHIFSLALGLITGHSFVNFSEVSAAHWIQVPNFDIPFVDYSFKLYPSAILTMAPIAFVTMTEHFGHLMVLNSLTERDYFKDPGLDHTLTYNAFFFTFST